uniref:ATP synthase F0 subunit 6 n=1 Tax=Willemoesia forceps TaxID=2600091 RepID=UPI00286C09D5|nr:ATP synthase F0 subunit 6 [Willemoesia forceps]WLW41804.1 ATP synthase F0 subunit 6 [Willemoesia forceps]
MMTSLFSVFDPSSSIFNTPLNWLSTSLGIMFIPYLFWVAPSRWSLLWMKTIYYLHTEFSTLLKPPYKMSTILFISLFSLIIFNNSLGLFPYIFTSSSHLIMTLTLSLPLWISFMIYGWVNHTKHMFTHLVPQGTPSLLMPLMVLIETISNLIRPGTLAVRLAANMIAGHLILTLLSQSGASLTFPLLLLLLLSQILLLILEAAVAIIQSYVFSTLSTLYASEIN